MTRLLILMAIAITLISCEKSRADYRNEIARDVCRKMKECGEIGPDGKFADLDDCNTELRERYNGMWPAKKCENRIAPEKFDHCKSRALTKACDGNLLDSVSFKLECGANDVCVAEPQNSPPSN